jgi:hypothetical protein
MIFDTDVLIWILRGKVKATQAASAAEARQVSVITCMELVQGARNQKELREILSFLAEYNFSVLPLTEGIGHRALIYLEEYGLRTRLYITDALIAATATENSLPLCTANAKHYRVIQELELKIFRP